MAENVDGLMIGGALLRLRESRGLSRQQAADLMGSTASSIFRIETDDRSPRLEMLQRMVLAYGGRVIIDSSGIRVQRMRLPGSSPSGAAEAA